MKQSKYITIITMACALFFASCSDEYMENMNTDPSKAATIDPNAQLTTAQLQTYGDLSMMEIYRNYHYAFTQQLMGCWNTTNYGGRHTLDNNEMSRIWTSFYTQSLKNIIDAQYRTAEDAEKVNINSVLRIYRVYLMSIITDTYGDAPFSEAGSLDRVPDAHLYQRGRCGAGQLHRFGYDRHCRHPHGAALHRIRD